MDNRWNFDKLYNSFNSEKFKKDLNSISNMINEIDNFSKKNFQKVEDIINVLENWINLLKNFYHIYEKIGVYCSLSLSENSKNVEAKKFYEMLQVETTKLVPATVKFQQWIQKIENIDQYLTTDLLKEHKFYIFENIESGKYLLSESEEVVFAKMRTTSSQAWSLLYDQLTSNLMVDIELDGEKKSLPLPAVRNLAYSKEMDIRKKGYYAELKAYKKIETSIAAALNSIKGEVLNEVEMRGYNSPLDKTLKSSRMDKDILDAMFKAIDNFLPKFREYLKRKAELLGDKKSLPFYNLFAPMGKLTKEYSYKDAQNFVVAQFKTFSDKLSNFAKTAFEDGWIDPFPREGKTGGAFCANINSIKESRILSNFTGSFSDVITLAHELGHGYHGDCLKNESILNSDYPMPLAETASIFCETVVMKAALKELSKEESITVLEEYISGATQVIVDIYSRYLFETKLFEERKNGSLSVEKLKNIFLDAQKTAYGDGLDHNFLHPYMWLNKPHYYEAEYNFYNFPYAFGQLFATGLYAQYIEKGEDFIPEYDNILIETGKNSILNVGKIANIDMRDQTFWENSLKIISESIDQFLDLTK